MGLTENCEVELVMGSGVFKSRVIRVQNDRIYLDAIPELNALGLDRAGVKAFVAWRQDGCRVSREAEIEEVLDPLPILVLQLQGEAFLQDSGEHASLAIQAALPLEYRLLRQATRYQTSTLTLSVEEVGFYSRFRLWKGLSLRLWLGPGESPIELTGEVIRATSQARQHHGQLQWEAVARFVEMTPSKTGELHRMVARERTHGVN